MVNYSPLKSFAVPDASSSRRLALRFLFVCAFALVGWPCYAQVIERELFDGTVLEFPEGTSSDVVERLYSEEFKRRYQNVRDELSILSPDQLLTIYRIGMEDARLNAGGNALYSSLATIRSGMAASILMEKAGNGDPLFLVPAARIHAINCMILDTAASIQSPDCENARSYLDEAIAVFENAEAMVFKGQLVEQGRIGYRQSDLLAADLFLRAAGAYWALGYRDEALVFVGDALRLHPENSRAQQLLNTITN